MEKKTIISAQDLCIGYRTGKKEKRVHEHLSFELHAGELTCLLGANGAGKSTLLRTLSASQPALEGDVQMMGKSLSDYSEKERSSYTVLLEQAKHLYTIPWPTTFVANVRLFYA